MHHSIHKFELLFRASCIGAIVGVIAAVAGLAVEGWNVDRYGAEYSSYQFHYVAVGALPGMIIAENRSGADYRLGEVMHHKTAVVGWNAFVFAFVSAGIFTVLRRQLARPGLER